MLEGHVQSVLNSQGHSLNAAQGGGWFAQLPGSRAGGDLHVAIGNNGFAPELVGLAEHRFDIDAEVAGECLSLTISAGPDAKAWGDPVELLRAQCLVAMDLLNADMLAVLWAGADSVMGADYFRRMVGIWLNGGAFPALGLAALVKDESGVVRSVGLDVLVGQDVAVLPDEGLSPTDQARLAMRVMDFLVREGPVQQDQSVEVDGFGAINVQIDPREGFINLYR